MKNYVQPGKTIPIVATATRAAGLGMVRDRIFGVLVTDAVSGEEVNLAVEGVFELELESAAITALHGELAYVTPSGTISDGPNGTTNLTCGIFLEDVAPGDTTAVVRLNGYCSIV